MRIGLVNFNRRGIREPDVPPVPPIGLEYLVDDLEEDHHEVSLLDLCFVDLDDRKDAIAAFVRDKEIIGVTFRNIGVDNYWMVDDQFFVPDLKAVVKLLKDKKDIPVVLGGQGFSIYPDKILAFTGADFGVSGPGEIAFSKLVNNLGKYKRGTILSEPPNLTIPHKRQLIDYDKYVKLGGSPAVQSKRGCPLTCSFCVEAETPLQIRPLDLVLEELKIFLSKGVEFLFVADAEFNSHLDQGIDFCERILEEGLEFKWSTYLNPAPLTEELIRKMKDAGCTNPCVSATSGDDSMLEVFETVFTVNRIRKMAEWFHKYEFPFTVDVMFGGPGETLASAQRTIALMDEICPSVVGMNFGVRIYANTRFGQKFLAGHFNTSGTVYGNTDENDQLFLPVFYISDMRIGDYLKEICNEDPKYRLLGYSNFGGINYKIAEM